MKGENTYVRPTYAGNALTKVKTTQDVNFLTFRSSNFDEAPTAPGNPQITEVPLPSGSKTEFVKEDSSDSGKPDLTSARIVVSGGRGVKSK
jgi:electron transfer flavoprotein alpha subunit